MDYKKLRDTRNSSNPFAQRLGIFVEEIGPGYARAVKDITAEDANPVGVAHGGCYFSLADTAVFLYAYFLKLSFKLTDRLNTRWPGLESLLSRQK